MKDNNNNANATATAANDTEIEVSSRINRQAVKKSLAIESVKVAQKIKKGDIIDTVLVRAKGISAFGKFAVELENTVHPNGANRWHDMLSDILGTFGENGANSLSFHVDEIPMYGGRNAEYGRAEEYLTILSKSYTVRLRGRDCDYLSAILSGYGVILPTITDYETAEKICKIANRLFARKENPSEVFGQSSSDKQAQRIKTLEATQARLLAEIAELKKGKAGNEK